jgi:hypothetical protein
MAVARVGAIGGACAICAASHELPGETGPPAGPRAVHADDAVIAFAEPDMNGVLIAPRRHIESLSTTTELAGDVLAGVRRAAVAVQVFYGASGVSVEPTSDFPGAPGHVCFRILPTLPARLGAGAAQLEMFVSVLRGVLTSVPASPTSPPVAG